MVKVAKEHAPDEEMATAQNKLDQEVEQYAKHAKKEYRRLKPGHISFSPEASIWIR